jgi:hypothetical protein
MIRGCALSRENIIRGAFHGNRYVKLRDFAHALIDNPLDPWPSIRFHLLGWCHNPLLYQPSHEVVHHSRPASLLGVP